MPPNGRFGAMSGCAGRACQDAGVTEVTRSELLAAYDAELRGGAEAHGAESVTRLGPLWLAVYDDGGFCGYHDLAGAEGAELEELIEGAIAFYRDQTDVGEFEWKTRGHDAPADLPDHLVAHGFVPGELETVMVGEAVLLAGEVSPPDGVVVRRAGDGGSLAADAARAMAMQDEVFGRGGGSTVEHMVQRLTDHADRLSLWLAEAGGEVVSAGRIEIVPGTEFAGIWGGATRGEWRGRGIYRALTAARARWALDRGARLVNSDCSPMSRPILERSGLLAITTTTPYLWTRP